MPRDGSNVYAPPAGTTATPGTTIESAKYNAFVTDLTNDANLARPIVAGGTGATTQAGALTALGAQPLDADLTAIAALGYTSGSYLIKKTAAGTWSLISLTAAGEAILDDADAAAQLVTLGAQPLEATLTSLSGLTLSSGALLYATAADTLAVLAPGSDGEVLTLVSGLPDWAAGGGAADYQTFTADGTWTKPAGIDADTMVWVELWSAASSGRRNATDAPGGSGGGYVRAAFRAGDLPGTVAVTVGVGGAASAGNGVSGGATSFGTYLGASGAVGPTGASGAAAGAINLVDKAIAKFLFAEAGGVGGASGVVGTSTTNSGAGGGGGSLGGTAGGTSFNGGNGGLGGDGSPAPVAGTAPGGAGGGGINVNSGAGANGEVRVWIG